MKKPIKPGSEAGHSKEGGALGNIDEQRGHPGKGTGGPSVKDSESGNRSVGTRQDAPDKRGC
ncbi:hypothetical protein [Methylobacterium trifolii]|uniref:Uncharacterized protein n=1 Tax=Methylobacterium trifolii TaxID=1003092 RepID=A0ABQ4U8I6_9HYPH|nr:hypothetical protein [Methylobacterium trifolii]GJE62723.1 hypothetical protein MPOCJGCO_4858 [Methylobacterium trifolii]